MLRESGSGLPRTATLPYDFFTNCLQPFYVRRNVIHMRATGFGPQAATFMLLAVWALCEFFLFWSHRSPDEGDLGSTALGNYPRRSTL